MKVEVQDSIKLKDSIEVIWIFGVKNIDDIWSKNEFGLAVLEGALGVETILFYYLLNALSSTEHTTERKRVKEIIEKWTLGTLKEWCASFKLFSGDELKELQPLIEERNKIVHDRGYIDRGKTDSSVKGRWEEVVNIAKRFIGKYGTVKVA